MLHATSYEGTAQLLSLTELKLHLFELYFVGWTIKPMKLCIVKKKFLNIIHIFIDWQTGAEINKGLFFDKQLKL